MQLKTTKINFFIAGYRRIEFGCNHVEAIGMDSNETTSRRDFDNSKQTQRQTYVPILAQEQFISFAISALSVQQDGSILRLLDCRTEVVLDASCK